MTESARLRIGWIIATVGFAIWLFADLTHSSGLVMLGTSVAALGLNSGLPFESRELQTLKFLQRVSHLEVVRVRPLPF